jgi:hypothetical protein
MYKDMELSIVKFGAYKPKYIVYTITIIILMHPGKKHLLA